MRLIVYGDVNCPYSYLASQRVDALRRLGRAEVDWRAVEHDPTLSMTGTPSAPARDAWARELAEVAALALPDERVPVAVPPLISNTLAATSAYAEAVTDGIQHELRAALFDEIWLRQRHLSGAYDVRAVLAGLMYPQVAILPYLTSQLPLPGYGDPSPAQLTRILGGAIAANGIPLTTTGWRRAQQWRREWLAIGERTVPVVIDPERGVLPGVTGLAYLAELITGRTVEPARVQPLPRPAPVPAALAAAA